MALAQTIGLKLWDKVSLVNPVSRKSLYAIQRLQQKPVFDGKIQKDATYILVDDIITQGGTISELRKHVLLNGGKVVAVAALAFSIGSCEVAPSKEIKIRFFAKFGDSVFRLIELGIVNSFEELTNSQIKYLLKFSSVWNICNKAAIAENLFPAL
jgi:hypothetical protein